MSYRAFPMPEDYPGLPEPLAGREVLRRLRRALRPARGDHASAPKWSRPSRSTASGRSRSRTARASGEIDALRAVLVANGHHWDPRWPEPAFPGSEEFDGEQIHVHHYREPDMLVGKRVLVLGIGNSAVDVAVESSRIAEKTFLAMRRGAYVIPKFLGGKPIDEAAPRRATTAADVGARACSWARLLKLTVGEMTDYGLPKPDHKLLEAHPDRLLGAAAAGRPRRHHDQAQHRPLRRRQHGALRRRQRGGDRPRRLLHRLQDRLPVPRPGGLRVARTTACRSTGGSSAPDHPGLYFIGFVQPLGPIMPIAEAQSEWVADLLQGRAALPSRRRCAGDRSARKGDGEALRRLEAPHDRGRLPPLPARDPPRAQALSKAAGCSAGLTRVGARGSRPSTELVARTVPLDGRGSSCGTARAGGRPGAPAFGAAAGVVGSAVDLRRLAGPPDQPEGAEDRDLEDHEEEEDRQESVHVRQSRRRQLPRLLAQEISASVWASSRPRADSVGTSRVGAVRFWAHS